MTASQALSITVQPLDCSRPGTTVTCTYHFTGALAIWTAPAGVTSATVTLDGAQGGSTAPAGVPGFAAAGKGATVTAAVPVVPGEIYQVAVGGMPSGQAGGFKGGGSGGV